MSEEEDKSPMEEKEDVEKKSDDDSDDDNLFNGSSSSSSDDDDASKQGRKIIKKKKLDVKDDSSISSKEESEAANARIEKTLEGDDDEDNDLLTKPLPNKIRIPDGFPWLSKKQIEICKIPNFIFLETDVYNPNLFDEAREKQRLKEYSREYVGSNIIRWRYKLDDKGQKIYNGDDAEVETNARIVEWEDGSRQLLIGDDAFDIDKTTTNNSCIFVATDDVGSSATVALESLGTVSDMIKLKPSGISTSAMQRAEITRKVETMKKMQVEEIDATCDPDREQLDLLKREEDKIRQSVRAQGKAKPGFHKDYMESQPMTRRQRYNERHNDADMQVSSEEEASFDSEDDDEDEEPKEKSTSKKRKVSSDDDDSDDAPPPAKKPVTAPIVRADNDSDSNETPASVKVPVKRKKVITDSDSDD